MENTRLNLSGYKMLLNVNYLINNKPQIQFI